MDQWELQWHTVIVRAILVHVAPLVFHALDVASNQTKLVSSYHAITKKLIFTWTCISFSIFALLHDFTFPDDDEITNLQGISKVEFLLRNKFIFLIANIFAVLLLYFLILRKKSIKRNNSFQTVRRNSHSQ